MKTDLISFRFKHILYVNLYKQNAKAILLTRLMVMLLKVSTSGVPARASLLMLACSSRTTLIKSLKENQEKNG